MHPCYLIYHPARTKTVIGKTTVHHDKFGGNEDPYLWNKQFLHTYCHITQLPNVEGQINFWISGDRYPNFSHLYCDCVFVIKTKHYWNERNNIDYNDPIIDSEQAYEHHYKWTNPPYNHHHYQKRRRYTLKADAEKSFQPQQKNGELVDILPFLNAKGITTLSLIEGMTSKKGSRPFCLDNKTGQELYKSLLDIAAIILRGKELTYKHPNWQEDNRETLNGCCP